MSVSVFQVPPDHIHAIWDKVEVFINRSVNESWGDVETQEIKTRCLSGEYLTVVVVDDESMMVLGVVIVYLMNRINDKVAMIVAIGGKGIVKRESHDVFRELLKTHGATVIEGAARPSLAKLYNRLGYSNKAIVTQFKLR
jgi:single-stranded DNA-specific DHH superfamily exonuclease